MTVRQKGALSKDDQARSLHAWRGRRVDGVIGGDAVNVGKDEEAKLLRDSVKR
jgi:hypothetical protein